MTPGVAKVLATVGGLGYVPRVGGVAASILGLVFAVGVDGLGGGLAVLALGLGLAALGVLASEAVLRAAADGLLAIEPRRLVIRELAGQVLTAAVTPMNPAGILIAFGAFQLFMLARPWPPLESLVPVPRGVAAMADAVFAAIGAGLIIGFMTWTLGTV